MLNKEQLEQKYLQTFGEEIVFDEVTQRDDFLIASKKEEKNRFLMGGGGVENERNSMTYYVINTKDGTDMTMKLYSQKEVEIPHLHTEKYQKTSIEIFSGNNPSANLSAFGVYIDTADNAQISEFLTGTYPQAEYSAHSPKTEELFKSWYHAVSETHPVQSERFDKYHKAEIEEIKKNLKAIRHFFANFVGSKTDLKVAREHSSVMQRVSKFCKRVISRQHDSEINTVYKSYMDNNRF